MRWDSKLKRAQTIGLEILFNEKITIFMIKLITSTNKYSGKKTVAKKYQQTRERWKKMCIRINANDNLSWN